MKYIFLSFFILSLSSCSLGNLRGEDETKKPLIHNNTGAVQVSNSGTSISDDDSGSFKNEQELQDIQKDIDAIFSDIENAGK